jgi:hypothetical protein
MEKLLSHPEKTCYTIFWYTGLPSVLRECPARFDWLKVVSINMSLLKEEAPRIPADFVNPLSSERPFKF